MLVLNQSASFQHNFKIPCSNAELCTQEAGILRIWTFTYLILAASIFTYCSGSKPYDDRGMWLPCHLYFRAQPCIVAIIYLHKSVDDSSLILSRVFSKRKPLQYKSSRCFLTVPKGPYTSRVAELLHFHPTMHEATCCKDGSICVHARKHEKARGTLNAVSLKAILITVAATFTKSLARILLEDSSAVAKKFSRS